MTDGVQRETAPISNLVVSNTSSSSGKVISGDDGYVWYVVLLLAFVNILSYMDRTALSVLMPAIKGELRLSDGELGLLVGMAFFLFYAIAGIPIARWADTGVRRNIIALTLSIWSVMTALSGAAQNFWHLLAARVGLGIGEAGCIPAAESIIADYVPQPRRPRAYAIHALGYTAGTMSGLILAGYLGEIIGWRWTFVVLGAPGLVFASLVLLTLREPRRGAQDDTADEAQFAWRDALLALWSNRLYCRVVLFLVVNAFAFSGLTQWWPSFYERCFGLSLASVGVNLGLAIGLGAGSGTLIGGLLAHNAAKRGPRRTLEVGAVAIALTVPVSTAALFTQNLTISFYCAFTTILLWSVPNGAVLATLFGAIGARLRATASSISTLCMSVLGFALGPSSVGLLSDALAPALGVRSLQYALLLPVIGLGVLVICLRLVSSAVPAASADCDNA